MMNLIKFLMTMNFKSLKDFNFSLYLVSLQQCLINKPLRPSIYLWHRWLLSHFCFIYILLYVFCFVCLSGPIYGAKACIFEYYCIVFHRFSLSFCWSQAFSDNRIYSCRTHWFRFPLQACKSRSPFVFYPFQTRVGSRWWQQAACTSSNVFWLSLRRLSSALLHCSICCCVSCLSLDFGCGIHVFEDDFCFCAFECVDCEDNQINWTVFLDSYCVACCVDDQIFHFVFFKFIINLI